MKTIEESITGPSAQSGNTTPVFCGRCKHYQLQKEVLEYYPNEYRGDGCRLPSVPKKVKYNHICLATILGHIDAIGEHYDYGNCKILNRNNDCRKFEHLPKKQPTKIETKSRKWWMFWK